MKFVLDASFALSFLLPDEKSTQVIKVFEDYLKGKVYFVSPKILSFEVTNGIKYAVYAKRITQKTALDILETFLELEINFLETDLKKILISALNENLSIYDASYTCLAENLKIPLLTLDKRLIKLASRKN